MGKLKLSKTVGGLNVPPTKRARFETMWIDLIYSSPANPLFRARTVKYKDVESIDDLISNKTQERDKDGLIRKDLIEIVFDCWVADWGGWSEPDENGDRKSVPLLDDTGNEVELTLENFEAVIREVEGGEYLFVELIRICQTAAWFKIAQTGEEKNFLRGSPEPSTKASSPRTRKGRRRGAA